jgi:hypothetical protein
VNIEEIEVESKESIHNMPLNKIIIEAPIKSGLEKTI